MNARETLSNVLGYPLSGHERFYEILLSMAETYSRKNSDYSGGNPLGNFKECERAGIPAFDGLITRLGDKYSRICHLTKISKAGESPKVNNESLKDTMLDLSVYSIIGSILIEELEKEKGA